jgi:hypothetical protein
VIIDLAEASQFYGVLFGMRFSFLTLIHIQHRFLNAKNGQLEKAGKANLEKSLQNPSAKLMNNLS